MRCALLACGLLLALLAPARGAAFEPAPPLSDREIIERLTRLEEGQNSLREGQNSLREGQNSLRAELNQLRTEMREQNAQLRQELTAQFDRGFQFMLAIVGAFAAIVATTIGFAMWDRRTMVRPFESRVKAIEDEISRNRQRLHALLEALRALSQRDQQVAEVLKQFDLL